MKATLIPVHVFINISSVFFKYRGGGGGGGGGGGTKTMPAGFERNTKTKNRRFQVQGRQQSANSGSTPAVRSHLNQLT